MIYISNFKKFSLRENDQSHGEQKSRHLNETHLLISFWSELKKILNYEGYKFNKELEFVSGLIEFQNLKGKNVHAILVSSGYHTDDSHSLYITFAEDQFEDMKEIMKNFSDVFNRKYKINLKYGIFKKLNCFLVSFQNILSLTQNNS